MWPYVFSRRFYGFGVNSTTPEMSHQAEIIKRFYIGDANFTHDEKIGLLEFMTDQEFAGFANQTAKMHSNANQTVYVYELTHRPSISLSNFFFGRTTGAVSQNLGVCHADDLLFLFTDIYPGALKTPDDFKTSGRVERLYQGAKSDAREPNVATFRLRR